MHMQNLKEQLTSFDWSLKSIFKVAVGVVVIAIALSIVINVLKPVAQSVGLMQKHWLLERQCRSKLCGWPLGWL